MRQTSHCFTPKRTSLTRKRVYLASRTQDPRQGAGLGRFCCAQTGKPESLRFHAGAPRTKSKQKHGFPSFLSRGLNARTGNTTAHDFSPHVPHLTLSLPKQQSLALHLAPDKLFCCKRFHAGFRSTRSHAFIVNHRYADSLFLPSGGLTRPCFAAKSGNQKPRCGNRVSDVSPKTLQNVKLSTCRLAVARRRLSRLFAGAPAGSRPPFRRRGL